MLDATVKLVTVESPPQAVVAVYVRASAELSISEIPSGTFRLVFSQGSHWSEASSRFPCRETAQEFEDVFDFTNSDWEVTLNAVPGGTAETNHLDPNEFTSY